jgi:glycosyltransferase involved in cell wall biosynthesis
VKRIVLVGTTGHAELAQVIRVAQSLSLTGRPLEVYVVGPQNAAATSLTDGAILKFTGSLRHFEALRYIVGADVLISALSQKRSQVSGLSSKLYEFLATGRPVIQINPTAADQELTQGLESVYTLQRPADAELRTALVRALQTPAHALAEAKAFGAQFDRGIQTRELVSMLSALCP